MHLPRHRLAVVAVPPQIPNSSEPPARSLNVYDFPKSSACAADLFDAFQPSVPISVPEIF